MAEAGYLKLVVDSTSVGSAEKALDSLARAGGTVEGKITIDMGNIEAAMARLAQQMGYLDKTMVDGFAKMVQASQKTQAANNNTVRSFEEIRRAVDPLYAAQQRYASVLLDVNSAVVRGEASQAQANAVLEIAASHYLGVETAAEKMAAQMARVEQAEREAAAATEQAVQSYQTLRASLDPLYASSQRYEQAQETLAAAVKAGAVSQEQASRVLKMAETQMLSVDSAASGMFASIGGGKQALKQTAFQLNQIAQQGAVTGQWMSAISVQAADMLTVFGTWGILAGGVIALGGPLAMSLFNVKDKAKALTDQIDDLNDTTSAMQSSFDAMVMSTEDMSKKFGSGADNARKLYSALYQIQALDYATKLKDTIKTVSSAFDEMAAAVQKYDQMTLNISDGIRADQIVVAKQAMTDLAKETGLTVGQARQLTSQVQALRDAKGPEQVAAATQALAAGITAAVNSGAQLTPEMIAAAKSVAEMGVNAQTTAAMMEATKTATDGATASANSLAGGIDNARIAAQALLSTMNIAATTAEGQAKDQIKVVQAQIKAIQEGKDAAIAAARQTLQNDKDKYAETARAAGMSEEAIQAEIKTQYAQRDALLNTEGALSDVTKQKQEEAKASRAGASAAKKDAAERERITEQLKKQAQQWREQLDPMEKYRREMSDLQNLSASVLKDGLTPDEMAAAQQRLNLELADSLPLVSDLSDAWGQFVASGFKDLDNFGDAFKTLLAQMASDAMKQQIVLSLGLNGSTSGGTVASAAGAASSGSSVMSTASTAMNAIKLASSNFMASAWATISSTWASGLSGLTGSVSSAFSAMTSAASGWAAGSVASSTALASLGTALGAVAAPLAAVAAAVSFFSTKTKLLDSGLRVTISDNEALVETYKKIKKTKFWGLSSSTSTGYSAASAEVSDPITSAIYTAQASIMSMASTLGVASSAFDSFAYNLTVSTKGLTDDEIATALEDALSGANDAYALMIGGLDDLIDTGETATEALTRLSTAITTVNGALDTLNYSFAYAGITGAAAADSLTDLFGSVDDFSSSVSSYWDAFYSEAEQQAILTRQATTALAAYNVALPTTRDGYRALIDAQDLSTESGRALWAVLVQMSSVMDEILPTISSITSEVEALLGTTSTALGDAITSMTDLAKLNAQAADDWYKVADNVADLIADIRGTASSVTTDLQALSYNQARYLAAYQAAMSGDLDAAGNVATYAKAYLSSTAATASTRADAAIAQAKIVAQLSALDSMSTTQAATFDTIANLQEQTITVLQALSDLIDSGNIDTASILSATVSGNGLTSAQLAEIQANNGLSDAQVAALASLNSIATSSLTLSDAQIARLQTLSSLTASSNSLTAAQVSAVKIISGLSSANNTLTASQLSSLSTLSTLTASANGLSSAQVSALSTLKTLTSANTGLSTAQLSALTSLNTLGASELQAFATALGILDTQTTTLGGSLRGISENVAAAVGSDNSAEMLAAMTSASTNIKSVVTAIASLRSAILDQGKISSVNDVLAGLSTNSAGQTYLTSSDLTQLASIYGISTSGKSSTQLAKEIAAHSSSDNISSGSYVLDLSGAKQAARAALEAKYEAAVAALQTAVSAVVSFDAATGGDIVNASGGVTSPYVNSSGTLSWDNGAPKAVSGASSADLAKWKASYWADGGLEDRMNSANDAVKTISAKMSSYDGGGYTGDGARSGGLDGQGGFLAMMHPQETVIDHTRGGSAGSGTGLDDLVAEIRALRQDNAAMRAELAAIKDWAKKGAESATTTAKGTKQALAVGWGVRE